MSQIQISYFSRHFYVVNVILLSVLHFWTNFDTKKILFIFYDSFFKAMTFSECPEPVKEISDSLVITALKSVFNREFLNRPSWDSNLWPLNFNAKFTVHVCTRVTMFLFESVLDIFLSPHYSTLKSSLII